MNINKHFIKNLLSAIYPNKCICCGELFDEEKHLCESCDKSIERINLDDLCLDCGLEKLDCVCKYNVFRFTALVCAFKNLGLSQKAYYLYKFYKKQHYAKFFANEMCVAIKKCYKGVNFDLICVVPSFKKHGYDHSRYIAKEISQILDIPLSDNLLSCVKKGKSQHKSTIKERLTNVYGKYRANYRVSGLNILLIDDIKTTGATIDECTRVLLFAGANSVRCATALVTVSNKKQKIEN